MCFRHLVAAPVARYSLESLILQMLTRLRWKVSGTLERSSKKWMEDASFCAFRAFVKAAATPQCDRHGETQEMNMKKRLSAPFSRLIWCPQINNNLVRVAASGPQSQAFWAASLLCWRAKRRGGAERYRSPCGWNFRLGFLTSSPVMLRL